MAERYLATYLNDHLAGAVVALQFLEHLQRDHAGTPVAPFAAALHGEVAADRRELEGLMTRLQVAVSRPRKAAAWLGEKVTQVKLRLDDLAGGSLRLLEVLDALSVGIEGKRLLWRALSAAAEGTPALRTLDYDRLEQRAEEQRRCVELVRREAARKALGSAAAAVTARPDSPPADPN